MLINWFTIIAQIVNFLILVILLKYLLYDRIVSAMDERERKIRERLESAEKKQEEAENRKQELQAERRSLEDQRQGILAEARKEAENRRKQLLEEARSEVDKQEKQWREALQRQKDSVIRDLRRMVRNQVYAISEKALKDLADVAVGRQAARIFLDRFEQMDEDDKQAMVTALRQGDNEMTVSSSHELSDDTKAQIDKKVKEVFGNHVETQYQTDAELVCGVELSTSGRKIAWNLTHYLRGLEESAREALEKEAQESQAA